jgi:16S rRNA C967 or C1407 C5-methylase (RsmB/RsmF family)
MKNSGCLIANEVDAKRRAALRFNLSKFGVLNAVVTSMDLSKEIKCKEKFGRILLDAPCSCEGQFRKNPQALEQWSFGKVIQHSRLQKKLIYNSLKMLGVNGILVYSTCTLAPEENEEVIDFALGEDDSLKLEPIKFPAGKKFKTRNGVKAWGDKTYRPEVENCVRVYPQDNDSEGFFIAKIKKCGR